VEKSTTKWRVGRQKLAAAVCRGKSIKHEKTGVPRQTRESRRRGFFETTKVKSCRGSKGGGGEKLKAAIN